MEKRKNKQLFALLLATAVTFSAGSVLAKSNETTNRQTEETESPVIILQDLLPEAFIDAKETNTGSSSISSQDNTGENSTAHEKSSNETELVNVNEENDTPPIAGPDDQGEMEEPALTDKERKQEEKLERLIGHVKTETQVLEDVGFDSIEQMIRSNNLTIQGLEENIQGIENLDYEDMEDTLRKSLNGIANSQESMTLMARSVSEPFAGTIAVNSLQSTYNSLYEQFENLRDGDLQRSNRAIIRQLKNAEDQLVMGGESLYIALVAMETQQTSLERQLSALDRTMEEMELRYSLGQISALQLNEVKTGRAALVSGIETLKMNIRIYKSQLENMLGASLTGEISLAALPTITEKQILAMDVEKDYLAAKEKSYELYAAARTLETAQDTYNNQGQQYGYRDSNAMYVQALHTWNAAQITYNASVQSYELKFRTLYEQVKDYYQVWNASKVALAGKQESYKATELKYQQGNISDNTLLAAQDEVSEAEEKVKSAANDLFSSYNSYCWAVQHGIIN